MENTSNNNMQNPTAGNVENENRPRLRKIKRPKQHNGPLGAPQSANAPHSQSYNQGNLVKADTRDMYKPEIKKTTLRYTEEVDDFSDDDFVYQENEVPNVQTFDTKKMMLISCICIVIGMVLGSFMFSGKQKVVRDGLQGVVVNPEVPNGRPRCGIAEKTQGCVLYIMNPQRQDLNGRDFYDLAAQLTGRQRFVIETGNMRYATVRIKPGNIAQLNIPPLQ